VRDFLYFICAQFTVCLSARSNLLVWIMWGMGRVSVL
jgi:hypothetical protein